MDSSPHISVTFDATTRELKVSWSKTPSDAQQTKDRDLQVHTNDAGELTGIDLQLPKDHRESLTINVAFRGDWYNTLNQTRGSWPRSILLTDGRPEEVAERLTDLVRRPEIQPLPADDKPEPKRKPCYPTYQPEGKPYWNNEWNYWVDIPKRVRAGSLPQLLKQQIGPTQALLIQKELLNWWLPESSRRGKIANTPYFDLASAILYHGQPSLLLVQGKTHSKEIADQSPRCRSSNQNNLDKIIAALAEANTGLHQAIRKMDPDRNWIWELSHRNKYEMSYSFAWAWKLTTLGIPTVLMYLGFLNDPDAPVSPTPPEPTPEREITGEPVEVEKDERFSSHENWENHIRNHCGNAPSPKNPIDNFVWEKEIQDYNRAAPLLPIIRSDDADLPLAES